LGVRNVPATATERGRQQRCQDQRTARHRFISASPNVKESRLHAPLAKTGPSATDLGAEHSGYNSQLSTKAGVANAIARITVMPAALLQSIVHVSGFIYSFYLLNI
jgi:hypothetical protein